MAAVLSELIREYLPRATKKVDYPCKVFEFHVNIGVPSPAVTQGRQIFMLKLEVSEVSGIDGRGQPVMNDERGYPDARRVS